MSTWLKWPNFLNSFCKTYLYFSPRLCHFSIKHNRLLFWWDKYCSRQTVRGFHSFNSFIARKNDSLLPNDKHAPAPLSIKDSFGECFKQLLTTPAKLRQQVNWYRKPFPNQIWKKLTIPPKTNMFGDTAQSRRIMDARLRCEMTQTWIWHDVCLDMLGRYFCLPSWYGGTDSLFFFGLSN